MFEIIGNRSNRVRMGYCRRCGDCCYIWDKPPNLGGKKFKCEHLSFDSNGLAICAIYDERPAACREFPSVDDSSYKHCGFYWK